MALQYSYTAPWGDAYPSAYAICTTANWTRAANSVSNVGSVSAHFNVYRDKASFLAGSSPVFASDITVPGVDVSALTSGIDQFAQTKFAGSAIVA